MKKMKKFLALALSASMVMGMSLTSMAAEPEVSVDAPIYSYDITNIVVPTTYLVAFNPDGLDVYKNGDKDNPIRDQIVSKNYGIINKSTKDKVVTVTLKVEDLNGGKITFADQLGVENAAADDYVINLTLVAANADDEVQVGSTPASADLDTTGAELANVVMTPATSGERTLYEGENEVDFLLDKAVYTGSIDLDAAKGNNVAGDFELKSLAAAGKGITAFTFGGTMNANADWTKLTKGIKITAVYSNDNKPNNATPVNGTGALFVNPNPTFKTGNEVGTIKYRYGEGAMDALQSIDKVEIDINGIKYDGYNANKKWAKAVDNGSMITLPAVYMNWVAGTYPDDVTREATVTYTTIGNEQKTATVKVRIRVIPPTFTTGTAVGSINYVKGTKDDSVASISKIEIDIAGKMYDGYGTNKAWTAATDADGVVTFAASYIKWVADTYPNDATREATVTYVTVGGETKTDKVDVKIR